MNQTLERPSYPRKLKLTIAYDGSGYHGWQRQPGGVLTVQETLEHALARVVQHPVAVRGAGRTDTGVHAAGQVAAFYTNSPIPAERFSHALNSRLPADIRIRQTEDVDFSFDPILSVRTKLYRYTVFNHTDLPPQADKYCYHFWKTCSVEPMQQAARFLVGKHDFTSFSAAGSVRQTMVRNLLRCQVHRQYHWIYFDLEADGFLYHMVRNIVGTLLEIGRGHWPPEAIPEILAAQNRAAAGPMVPPNGLCMQWIKY